MAYNLLFPFLIVTNGDMSGNITSTIVQIREQDNVGIQLNWTGTPVGTFAVQVSADYERDPLGNVIRAGHWINVATNPTVAAAGTADSAYIDLNQLSAPYIRVVYTAGSSTGVLNAYATAKGV